MNNDKEKILLGRPKVVYSTVSKTAYNEFVKKHKKIGKKIDYTTWSKIVRIINETISEELIESGLPIQIPFGFGKVFVAKNSSNRVVYNEDGTYENRRPINWQETIKQGKYVYFSNNKTNGFILKLHWDKSTSRMNNARLFKFKQSAKVSKKISSYVFNTQEVNIQKYFDKPSIQYYCLKQETE